MSLLQVSGMSTSTQPIPRTSTGAILCRHPAIRRPLAGQDCPVCFDPLLLSQELVWCQAECGRSLHTSCWEGCKRTSGHVSPACPCCRAQWSYSPGCLCDAATPWQNIKMLARTAIICFWQLISIKHTLRKWKHSAKNLFAYFASTLGLLIIALLTVSILRAVLSFLLYSRMAAYLQHSTARMPDTGLWMTLWLPLKTSAMILRQIYETVDLLMPTSRIEFRTWGTIWAMLSLLSYIWGERLDFKPGHGI